MLFTPFSLRGTELANRVVMSPLTRSRAVEHNTPNALMAAYYAQRAGAGLIITEGTSPSPNGLGYPRIPGLFNQQHVAGWRLVTEAVHAQGGKIVVQLMHTGRVSHQDNLPNGAEVVGAVVRDLPRRDGRRRQGDVIAHAATRHERGRHRRHRGRIRPCRAPGDRSRL